MKHIKRYKLFETNNLDIKNNLMEMCYELMDDGFECSISKISLSSMNDIELLIKKTSSSDFNFNEIVETVSRIDDYVKDNLSESKIEFRPQFINNTYFTLPEYDYIGKQNVSLL
jgi:hypothetical protein